MADLSIEFVHMWVRETRGADSIYFDKESIGGFSEVGYYVSDVT